MNSSTCAGANGFCSLSTLLNMPQRRTCPEGQSFQCPLRLLSARSNNINNYHYRKEKDIYDGLRPMLHAKSRRNIRFLVYHDILTVLRSFQGLREALIPAWFLVSSFTTYQRRHLTFNAVRNVILSSFRALKPHISFSCTSSKALIRMCRCSSRHRCYPEG